VKEWESPYTTFCDNPIVFVDKYGDNIDNYHIFEETGKTQVERTDDNTNTYTYHKKDGSTVDLGTYSVIKNKTVSHKNNSAIKDMVDLENLNNNFIQTRTNTISSGNFYLDENVTAALLAASYKTSNTTGKKIFLNQLSGLDGKHSKHGGMGDRVDFQFIRTDNIAGVCHADQSIFDKTSNSTLVSNLSHFGFTNMYTQSSKTSKSEALAGTTYSIDHFHHLHADFNGNTLITTKYIPVLSTPNNLKYSEFRTSFRDYASDNNNSVIWAHLYYVMYGKDPALDN